MEDYLLMQETFKQLDEPVALDLESLIPIDVNSSIFIEEFKKGEEVE